MYLGIDLGTSEVKALVIDENHEVIASHSAPLSIQRPHPHWSEQAPELWWEATEYLMSTLREKCAQHWPAIKAIGLSGQMHGAVLLDEEGETIRPAILWNDTRCAAECAELEAMAPELHQVAGNLAMPGFTAPKLLWVRRHEPQHFQRTATVLLPKDYLRYRMTGKKVSDMSDAAGTLWLDVAKRDWSDALLDKCGLSRSQMPTLVEGCEVSATRRPTVVSLPPPSTTARTCSRHTPHLPLTPPDQLRLATPRHTAPPNAAPSAPSSPSPRSPRSPSAPPPPPASPSSPLPSPHLRLPSTLRAGSPYPRRRYACVTLPTPTQL
ncbi:FGGY family carbohydrate kinase, partial [Klebsiella pneumoniae]|uniref:FGGY family carbohydrate kinase n=1 Tax=Klebsiella pneumoniae TaxID=573 RepID=UPI00215D604F